MSRRTERNKALKDKLQRNRNMLVYAIMVAALLAAVAGWGLLPDLASINPNIEGAYYRPKGQLILMHFGMTSLFTGLFWKWPREQSFFAGAVISLGLTFLMLYANLGV